MLSITEKNIFRQSFLLNHLITKIIPPKYFQDNGETSLQEHPVGTGPFIFKEWIKGKRITLTRNKKYWKKILGDVDQLEFNFIPAGKQSAMLLNGTINLVTELPGTQTTKISKSDILRIMKQNTLLTPLFWFVNFRGPLANPENRRALNMAINKKDLIRYAAFGNGHILASIGMPGEIGYNSDLKTYDFDPQKAKEILFRIIFYLLFFI